VDGAVLGVTDELLEGKELGFIEGEK